MATITRTYQVDDLDGSEEDVRTVQLSLDGTNYEIDLSATNASRLRERLARYVEHGTRLTPQRTRQAKRSSKPAPAGRDQTHAIREWARQNGFEVSERGRISKSIQEAFDAAHQHPFTV